MTFVDDTYFDETIQTPDGPVRVMAETHIFGMHLVLDGFLFFTLAQSTPLKIGVKQVLAIRRSITVEARNLGFTEITTGITGSVRNTLGIHSFIQGGSREEPGPVPR